MSKPVGDSKSIPVQSVRERVSSAGATICQQHAFPVFAALLSLWLFASLLASPAEGTTPTFQLNAGTSIAEATRAPEAPQVVGGAPVSPGQFPFIVHVFQVRADGSLWHCTGSLIRNDWVLTAAHCGDPPPQYVQIGDVTNGFDGIQLAILRVAQWIPHPQYNNDTVQNDVALIRLEDDATRHPPFLNGVPVYAPSTIDLATAPSNTTSSIGNLTIAGFGRTVADDPTSTPPVVNWADEIPTFPMAICTQYHDLPLSDTQQLCFGNHPQACAGDSGSAVFAQVGQQYTQYGIVSYGERSCDSPSIATYVPGYVDWINQQIDGSTPGAPAHGSAVTPDKRRLLVSKSVGGAQWTITLDLDRGDITGTEVTDIVKFVYCTAKPSEDFLKPPTYGSVDATCTVGGPTTSSDAWTYYGPVTLPGTFFVP